MLTELPDQARARRQRGRARHAGQRDGACSTRCAAAGHRVEHDFADGDALIHALIAAGGHDPEFLTDDQLAAAPPRGCRSPTTRRWFATLPERAARRRSWRRWGPPPGERYVDGDDFVVAGLELGNVLVAIQPPRGYGENPVAIYHDPELAARPTTTSPPTAGSTPCWGADAIVHLGKHGTLEWLPGKALGAVGRPARPTPRLGDVPLFYPFVVNDPGEGVQAKRRAHAVIVDHLVPPMMRAETYDELAELEQLLDEYARAGGARPGEAARARRRASGRCIARGRACTPTSSVEGEQPASTTSARWSSTSTATCARSRTSRSATACTCSAGRPRASSCAGSLAAILRLGCGDVPGLRRGVGAAFGLDEPALLAGAGRAGRRTRRRRCSRASRGPAAHAPATSSTASRTRRRRCSTRFAARGWDPAAAPTRARRRSAARTTAWSRVAALRRRARSCRGCARTTDEIDQRCVGGAARPPRAGRARRAPRPAGALDVLPTGRNFYSVDPRALPSELAYETGARLADALLDRHLRETGELPARRSGSSSGARRRCARRATTSAEILALLGVRPRLAPARRAASTGLEVDPARGARPARAST